MRRMEENRLTWVHREREESVVMHGLVLNLIQLTGLLISDATQLEKLSTLHLLGWWLCQSCQSWVKGGTFCPRAARGHRTSPEQSLNSCRELSPLPLYFVQKNAECPCCFSSFNWNEANNLRFSGVPVTTVCFWVAPRLLFDHSWSTSAVRGAESRTSREGSRGSRASGEGWGRRRSLWRAFYSPGNLFCYSGKLCLNISRY